MVFCHQNCSGLLWEKKCFGDREKKIKFEAEGREFEKLLKFEAEGREFENFLSSLEKFIKTVRGQNNFW